MRNRGSSSPFVVKLLSTTKAIQTKEAPQLSRDNVIFLSNSSHKKSDEYSHFGGVCMGNNHSKYTKECEIEAVRLNSRVM